MATRKKAAKAAKRSRAGSGPKAAAADRAGRSKLTVEKTPRTKKSSRSSTPAAVAGDPLVTAGRNPEVDRLLEDRVNTRPWRLWGPYVAERQWGTVREDYSADGDAWNYLPHDHARSRAYRWGEDGIAGFSDSGQRLCLAVAFWNGKDPILKERFFGLANGEGNHGEDIKELHWYLDATPSMSYLKMLYKYPQRAFPYEELVRVNGSRSRTEPEYEILDTGVFDDDRYFDIEIEWAKASTDDLLLRIRAINRGPDAADLWILPQLLFRNTWAWERNPHHPRIALAGGRQFVADHDVLGQYTMVCDGEPQPLLCENETNVERLFGEPREDRLFKDGINDFVVDGKPHAARTSGSGTKAAMVRRESIPPGGEAVVRVRLAAKLPPKPFLKFEAILEDRRGECDAFFGGFRHRVEDSELRKVQRQAFAGFVWTRQYYNLDVRRWLEGDPTQPPPPP